MDFDAKDNPPKIMYNHDWLSKLTFEDIINLASNFTVQQMLERDMFEKRMQEQKPIYLHEFFYPLMQGYDSVVMDVDVEMCGTDQIFNALAGRTLLKKIKNRDKFVVAVTLMENPKTGDLMSKSKGTGVFLGGNANDQFGQVMSQPDEMIEVLFVNCTSLSLEEIGEIMKLENPRDAKMRLAYEIVKIYFGNQGAQKAQEYFINTFSKKELPIDIKEFVAIEGDNIFDFLVKVGFATSKGDARRKIEQGGVSISGEKITTENKILTKDKFNERILKVGKINFIKIVF
jgi:tyrosyl-tRNA synthetase